jgi:hypothetical protein
MGIENFLFKKPKGREGEEISDDELSPKGRQRRNMMFGGAALLGSTALHVHWANATDLLPIDSFSLQTPEGREDNVEKIREYIEWIAQNEEELKRPDITKNEINAIICKNVPALENNVLKGTEYDQESALRSNGYWKATQIEVGKGTTDGVLFRFAHEDNSNKKELAGYGNGFVIKIGDTEILISNPHVIKESLNCEVLADGIEAGGCDLNDLNVVESAKENFEKISVPWDRRKSKENLHGKLVHIPSVHNRRGAENTDKTDITSGVLFKISPNFFPSGESTHKTFFSQENLKAFGNLLQNSYMCIIPSREVNGDGIANDDDALGISGSPVFTDEDCKNGNIMPSGLVWGAGTIKDSVHKVSYTVAYIHGPDILGKTIDTVNTIVSGFMDEKEFPQKRALTEKVQKKLVELGYPITVDGDYGGYTQRAVFTFQERVFSKEKIDSEVIAGDVDRMTWDALFPDDAGVNKRKLYASMPVDLL